jgi:phosphoserine phosphatase RsbU/P
MYEDASARGDHPALTEDLEDLYENAPCGYLSLAPDGDVAKVNKTFADWIGTPADELLGKPFNALLSVPGRIFYETHFAPLLRMQGFFNEVALDVVKADGTSIPMLVNAVEKRAETGDLLFTRITLFVASERRRYEREQKALRLTAEQGLSESLAEQEAARASLLAEQRTSELREQFIAVLGHDLRNPLSALSGGISILGRQPQDERTKTLLFHMHASVQRMASLIDDVLDFARGRLGSGFALENRPAQLAPVLLQIAEELRLSHPDRVIETDLSLPAPVSCDVSRISQLVSNLLGNALTHGATDRPIRVTASQTDGLMTVTVANEGEPISAPAMERLFQPFFRGEVRASQQGLGLGLYIASEIARAHNGTLAVSSTPSQTCFTFQMPLS